MTSSLESEYLLPEVKAWLSVPRKLLIGNRWLEAADGKFLTIIDPCTGGQLATVAAANLADVNLAVAAARRALEGSWGSTTPAERGRLLWKLADLIDENAEVLRQLESLDTGKPVMETYVFDLPIASDHFRYFAGWATKITGESIPTSLPGEALAYTRREPVGLVGAITPWNFPLAIAAWKLAPALACGNTVILKPSELTPLSALKLGELILEAGFPPGVVNILPGLGLEAGNALVEHNDVDKISFTGSTRVGREILAKSGGNFKRVTLELGGKSPNIILPDADLDTAIDGSMTAIFFNQGEACVAGSRLFVPKSMRSEIVSALKSRAESIVQGFGLDPTSQMGPMVSSVHQDRVMGFVERGTQHAELIAGGSRNTDLPGFYVNPTIFLGNDDLEIAREEIFGPVLTILEYEDIEDLTRRANSSQYGLGAGIWTSDVRQGIRLAHALKAGSVWINGYGMLDAALPWGGFKSSGIGREMGSAALETYTELKTVWVNLL
jgi:acyl-CoA reductase-like NAD-dependent aldehyde dehydrogenase